MLIGNAPLGEIRPDQLVFFIPILGIVGWIVSILVKHQQRMAEIIHGTANQQSNTEITQLRIEVSELKALVHQQTIMLDSYTDSARRMADAPLQRRLEEV